MLEDSNLIFITRLIENTASLAFKMKTEKIIPAFSAAESICLSLDNSEDLQLEIKRRIAEWKLMIFCDRNEPFDQVQILYKGVKKLQYKDIQSEFDIEYYFAQYCFRNNRLEVAQKQLSDLLKKLELHEKEINPKYFLPKKSLIQDLLQKL